MTKKSSSPGPSGLMSIVLSIGIIGSSFLPLVDFFLSVSTWDICIGLIGEGGEGAWFATAYLVYMAMLAINIVTQMVNCNRGFTSSLAFIGTIFCIAFIVSYNSFWSVVGIGFYAIAIQVLLLYVASGLPSGNEEDDEDSLFDIIKDARNEHKQNKNVQPTSTGKATEVRILKQKVARLEDRARIDSELKERKRKEELQYREEQLARREEFEQRERELRRREEALRQEEARQRAEQRHRDAEETRMLEEQRSNAAEEARRREDQRRREEIHRKMTEAIQKEESARAVPPLPPVPPAASVNSNNLIDDDEIEVIG
ncbi:MAG: hypothetical protein E7088_05650 [Bacteroidales bacterium]|nr:hypothetical protein [Bacteroidales bacterium]